MIEMNRTHCESFPRLSMMSALIPKMWVLLFKKKNNLKTFP